MAEEGRIRDVAVQDLVKHNTGSPLEEGVMLKLRRFTIPDNDTLVFLSRYRALILSYGYFP